MKKWSTQKNPREMPVKTIMKYYQCTATRAAVIPKTERH